MAPNPVLHKIQIKLILKNLPLNALIYFIPILMINDPPERITGQGTEFLSRLTLENVKQTLVYVDNLTVAFCKINQEASRNLFHKTKKLKSFLKALHVLRRKQLFRKTLLTDALRLNPILFQDTQ